VSARVSLRPAPATALWYHLLAHLDLGRDAASLHDRGYLAEAGSSALAVRAPALARACATIADPLALQVLPLALPADAPPGALDELLEGGGPEPARGLVATLLGDTAGEALAAALAAALEDERSRFLAGPWRREEARLAADASRWGALLDEELAPHSAILGLTAEVEVRPCRALAGAGRALELRERTVVAVGPPRSADGLELLFQVLHELTHAASDPLVRGAGDRATREGAPGYAVHFRLEQAVLALDYHLLRRRRPALLARYLDWCAGWVVPDAASLPRLRALAAAAGIDRPEDDWRSLGQVASVAPRRATEAALEELTLVPAESLPALLALLER